MYYLLYPVLFFFGGGGGGGGGGNVSQAQYGSPRSDQTQGLYLESVALKN